MLMETVAEHKQCSASVERELVHCFLERLLNEEVLVLHGEEIQPLLIRLFSRSGLEPVDIQTNFTANLNSVSI